MNGWRSRLALCGLLWVASQAHAYATAELPNHPMAMLLYHGSAATVDLLLLMALPNFISGALCDDLEWLCQASIACNGLGLVLYMAWAAPGFYNLAIWILSLIQFGRLMMVDSDGNDCAWRDLVCRPHPGGPQCSSRKEIK